MPIYHIEGSRNIADLLTKKHEISIDSVSTGLNWQAGDDLMRLDIQHMPLSAVTVIYCNSTCGRDDKC